MRNEEFPSAPSLRICHPERGRPTAESRDPLNQETGPIAITLL